MKKILFEIVAFLVLACGVYLLYAWWTKPKPVAQPTAISPMLVKMSGPSFNETLRITTQEEKIFLGTWYLTPAKPPAENFIDVKTVDGKTLHISRSQINSMTSTAE